MAGQPFLPVSIEEIGEEGAQLAGRRVSQR
jgi:hypothetical protein